jgi:chemosensory pili system protein ChpA (sensor histidine kinase/response regulator)
VSTELQEGLMQTLMVPFGSIAPRLRRVVRKAALETGKQARLKLLMAGSSDQLDRNVLEHIIAPLEHMLRNAIAHGIEKPEERQEHGKDPEGEINIRVEAEATEFVIRVEDDGAGINRAAIRQRAIERGLIDESSDPPPQQLFELILGSGFSTSATVTGLAGRGVGMDVVNSEVKQIGGSLEIASEEGVGSCFTIRIPFTLAVMQAIGVLAGGQRYMIPLTSVAGVARVRPEEYRVLVESEQPEYHFGEHSYPILELDPLLGEPARPLSADSVSLLMIATGDQRAALRVTEVVGHREVVIKPVGPQITSVPGILGGTMTGDGRVVVILDPGPMVRQALLHGVRPVLTERQPDQPSRRKVGMVVDDSITMRRINARVLDSQGVEAITARDGQEAVEMMQDRVPDIVLLDIEMPRMDGYQLAEYVRGDARLRHIPIIMITSRSGEKHRERARRAGADDYLTKPYKEAELISSIHRLLETGER